MDTQAMVDAIASHAAASGHFERVNQYEPLSSPGNGLTAAVWGNTVGPVAAASGLAATSARVGFTLRIYSPAQQQPPDMIDPAMFAAADALMAAYSGDFELGGQVKEVDLLGKHGEPLGWRAGWLPQDNALYRVVDLNIPLIVNDAWTQAA